MPRARPGPLSTKKNKDLHGNLGDSSGDDASIDVTAAPTEQPTARRSYRLMGSSSSNFRTPEKENNATDYGLEFSTSNLRNPSPRRCSTLQTISSRAEPKKGVLQPRGNKSPTKNSARLMHLREEEAEKQSTHRGKQKQIPSKGGKQQTEESDADDDAASEDDADAASDEDDDHEQDKENSSQRTKQKEQLAGIDSAQGRKQQNPPKQVTQPKTRKQLTQQRAADEEDSEGNSATEAGNSSSDVSHTQETNRPQQRGTPRVVPPPAAKQQQTQNPTTSKASRQPSRSAVVRKPRKQLNPMQRDKRFWREVNSLQMRTDNLIPRLPFSRVVREIMQEASASVTYITTTALEAIQASAEMYLTQRLQDAYMLTLHRGRVTLDVRDLQLIKFLKDSKDLCTA